MHKYLAEAGVTGVKVRHGGTLHVHDWEFAEDDH